MAYRSRPAAFSGLCRPQSLHHQVPADADDVFHGAPRTLLVAAADFLDAHVVIAQDFTSGKAYRMRLETQAIAKAHKETIVAGGEMPGEDIAIEKVSWGHGIARAAS